MITKLAVNHYSGYYSFIEYLRFPLKFSVIEKRQWLRKMYYSERNQIQYNNLITVCLRTIYGNETI